MRQLECVRGVDFVAGPLLCGVLVVVFAIAIVPFAWSQLYLWEFVHRGAVTAVPIRI